MVTEVTSTDRRHHARLGGRCCLHETVIGHNRSFEIVGKIIENPEDQDAN